MLNHATGLFKQVNCKRWLETVIPVFEGWSMWHISHRWLILIYIVAIFILCSLRVSLAYSEIDVFTSTFRLRVTSSWDLAFVIKEPANRYWRASKDHKVVYVLVSGLHQSHWVAHHSHCVVRLSHWAARHSHSVAHHCHGVSTEVLAVWTLSSMASSESKTGKVRADARDKNAI
jgi:hypothetical protein